MATHLSVLVAERRIADREGLLTVPDAPILSTEERVLVLPQSPACSEVSEGSFLNPIEIPKHPSRFTSSLHWPDREGSRPPLFYAYNVELHRLPGLCDIYLRLPIGLERVAYSPVWRRERESASRIKRWLGMSDRVYILRDLNPPSAGGFYAYSSPNWIVYRYRRTVLRVLLRQKIGYSGPLNWARERCGDLVDRIKIKLQIRHWEDV